MRREFTMTTVARFIMYQASFIRTLLHSADVLNRGPISVGKKALRLAHTHEGRCDLGNSLTLIITRYINISRASHTSPIISFSPTPSRRLTPKKLYCVQYTLNHSSTNNAVRAGTLKHKEAIYLWRSCIAMIKPAFSL